MKTMIGQRILISILAPSLLIFGLLSALIAFAAARFVTVWTELELIRISETNTDDLEDRVESMIVAVQSAASILDKMEARDENGRAQAENIVKAMFNNSYTHNAWIACEPNAFDGRDAEHTKDYPGAPSGRFMRSYVVKDGQIVMAPDMDENTIDDPEESAWYVKPRDTGRLYVDASNDVPNMYDYGLGDDPICTMAFAAPIHRDGKVIGCVGVDMRVEISTLYAGRDNGAAIAVFYPNGNVFFARDPAFATSSVDTLGFSNVPEIKAAFAGGSPLYLSSQYSMFLSSDAFTYFQPIDVLGEGNLYLYTALPRSIVFNSLRPIFTLITGIIAAVFIFILLIIFHVKRRISDPIKALILAADAISLGNLETEIPAFPRSKDEIGGLSRSLHRMVEQFRIYILRLEQSQDEKIIFTRIDDIVASGGTDDTIESVLAILCEHIGASRATAVRLSDGGTFMFSRGEYEAEGGRSALPHDFSHHRQIMPMIAGKSFLFLNSYIISERCADFLDGKTRFACILPLREGSRALGYVVFESGSEKNPFGSKAESILCNIAQILSGLVDRDEDKAMEPDSEETLSEDDSPGGLDAVRGVKGLDSATAIQTMGGMIGLYEQALKLLASLLPENAKKLDDCIDNDLSTFAIEIHGLKGSLNNVGAYELGTAAARVEQAAKSGDESLCRRLYESFKNTLAEFHDNLVAAFEMDCGKLPGNILTLVAILPKAEEAAAVNCGAALELLRPMRGFSFDMESDALLEDVFTALEALETEKALDSIHNLREGLTNWEEA